MRRVTLDGLIIDQKRVINAPMIKSELIQVEGTEKSRGRAKIILVELVKKDMLIKEVIESMSLDRTEWQKIIHLTEAD